MINTQLVAQRVFRNELTCLPKKRKRRNNVKRFFILIVFLEIEIITKTNYFLNPTIFFSATTLLQAHTTDLDRKSTLFRSNIRNHPLAPI